MSNPVSYYDCKESVITERLSMKDWWNDDGSGKPMYFEKCLSQRHFIHRNTHVESSALAEVYNKIFLDWWRF